MAGSNRRLPRTQKPFTNWARGFTKSWWWRRDTPRRLGNAIRSSADYYNKFLGTIEGKGGVFSYGRQLGELAHSDGELAEIDKLQLDVREMESQEWSQPGLALAANAEESDEAE